MPEEKSLGKLIREARKRLGLTQGNVADKFDSKVSRGTVGRWEKNEQRISVQNFEELIGILDINEQEAYALYYAGGKTPPERHNLPRENRFFTGREGYLKDLRELLEKHHVVALSGLGGIGKTQIALRYANQHHPGMYPTALWVNATDIGILEAGFASLAETLKLPEHDKQGIESRIKLVKEWLKEHTNWLLIMDNADELPIVEPFLLSRPRGHIILTTRWHHSVAFAKLLPVEAMNAEDGRNFLLGRTGRSPEGTEADAVGELVEALGGHALALEQAGAYIDQTYIPFADYLKIYKRNSASLLSQHGALKDEHYPHRLTVAATFMGSFARAMELSPLAEDIMHFCVFLQPDVIPHELFEYDERFKSHALAVEEGLAALQRYSLLMPNELNILYRPEPHPVFSMHRLVQVVLIDNMSPDIQKYRMEQVVRALCAAFPSHFDYTYCRQCSILLPQVLECAGWIEDELILTVEAAELFHKAGCFQWGQWRYSEAETLLLRAISIYGQCIGVEHPRTLSALVNLAATYLAHDKYGHAEHTYRQALPISEKLLGTESLYTAVILAGVTDVYIRQGEFDQSQAFFERINAIHYAIQKRHADAQLPLQPGELFNSHTAIYLDQGRYEQTGILCLVTFLRQEKLLGPSHQLTQAAKKDYAKFLRSIGSHDEASALETNDDPPA